MMQKSRFVLATATPLAIGVAAGGLRPTCRSPLEEDISIWQKTGHFYFALTAATDQNRQTRCSSRTTSATNQLLGHMGANGKTFLTPSLELGTQVLT